MKSSMTSGERFYSFARVLLFYISSIVVFAAIAGLTKDWDYPGQISMLASSVFTFGLVLLFAKWDKLALGEIGLGFGKYSLQRFLGGFAIGFLLVLLQAAIVSGFAPVRFSLSANFSLSGVAASLMLYFFVACREELVFRSYALMNLARATKPLVALSVITALFVFEHVIAGVSWKMSILGSGFGGVLFGLSALKTKGLALPLGLHFAWNFTQWLLGFKDNTGVWREIVEAGNEQYAENVALAGFVVAMSIGICAIVIYYRRQNLDGSR